MALTQKQATARILKHMSKNVRYQVTEAEASDLLLWLLCNDTSPKSESILPSRSDILRAEVIKWASATKKFNKQAILKTSNSGDPWGAHLPRLLLEAIDLLEFIDPERKDGLGRQINSRITAMTARKSNGVLRWAYQQAYDWRLAFGFGGAFTVDMKKKGLSIEDAPSLWREFRALLISCAEKKGTDSKTRDRMKSVLERMPVEHRKWAVRILMGDMKTRTGIKTLAKVWPRMIPEYKVQCCSTYEGFNPGNGVWSKNARPPKDILLEPKMDGGRVNVLVRDPNIAAGEVRSRAGRPIPHLKYLVKQASDMMCAADIHDAYVLDCEGTSTKDKSWGAAMTAIKTEDLTREERDLKMIVFDMIPLDEFQAGIGSSTLIERKKRLYHTFKKGGLYAPDFQRVKMVRYVEKKHGPIRAFIDSRYSNYRNLGYEGMVMKKYNASYYAGASRSERVGSGMLRLKPTETIDLVIVSFYKGKKGTSIENILGGMVCHYAPGEEKTETQPNGKPVEIRVGGGISLDLRKWIWAHRKKLKGRVIEVERQKKENAEGITSRHTNLLRFRPDKTA